MPELYVHKAEKNRCTFVIVILKRAQCEKQRAMHFAVNNVSVPGLGSAHPHTVPESRILI